LPARTVLLVRLGVALKPLGNIFVWLFSGLLCRGTDCVNEVSSKLIGEEVTSRALPPCCGSPVRRLGPGGFTPKPKPSDIDDEFIWDTICQVAAKKAGVSADRAKAILASHGFDAFHHTGIVEAVEVVVTERGRVEW
jgi:hypothetical protein